MKIRIYRQTEQDFDRIEIEGATFETIVSRAAVEGLQCSGYNSKVSAMIFGKVFDVAEAVKIALFLIASERNGACGVDPKNRCQRNVGHVLFSLP